MREWSVDCNKDWWKQCSMIGLLSFVMVESTLVDSALKCSASHLTALKLVKHAPPWTSFEQLCNLVVVKLCQMCLCAPQHMTALLCHQNSNHQILCVLIFCIVLKATCLLSCVANENHELRMNQNQMWHLKEVRLKIPRCNPLSTEMNDAAAWRISVPFMFTDCSPCFTKQNKTSSSHFSVVSSCSRHFAQALVWHHPWWCARCSPEQPSSLAVRSIAASINWSRDNLRSASSVSCESWVQHEDTLCHAQFGALHSPPWQKCQVSQEMLTEVLHT